MAFLDKLLQKQNPTPLQELTTSIAATTAVAAISQLDWYGAEPLHSYMYYAFMPVINGSFIPTERTCEVILGLSQVINKELTFRGRSVSIPEAIVSSNTSISFYEDQVMTIGNYYDKWNSLISSANGEGWGTVNSYKKPILLLLVGSGLTPSGFVLLEGCKPFNMYNYNFTFKDKSNIVTPTIQFTADRTRLFAIWDIVNFLAQTGYTQFFPMNQLTNIIAAIGKGVEDTIFNEAQKVVSSMFNQ